MTRAAGARSDDPSATSELRWSVTRHPAVAPKDSVTSRSAARVQARCDHFTGSSVRALIRGPATSARSSHAPIIGQWCELGTAGRTQGADDVPSAGWGDRNQQRRGARVAKGHDTGSTAADVISRFGRTANPKSHFSKTFGAVSCRTLFSRFLHGVNREMVARRDNRGEWDHAIEVPACPVITA